jgi:hypothetical protein
MYEKMKNLPPDSGRLAYQIMERNYISTFLFCYSPLYRGDDVDNGGQSRGQNRGLGRGQNRNQSETWSDLEIVDVKFL